MALLITGLTQVKIWGGIPPFPPGIPGVSQVGSRLFQVGSHPGLWNIPCGIPPGIMERPTWDPTWDYGTSHMGSHQSLLGSHLVNHIAGGIAPGILLIPVLTLPKITDGFQLDILGKILRGILPIWHQRPQSYKIYQKEYLTNPFRTQSFKLRVRNFLGEQ